MDKQIQILKQKNKEANSFIIEIAKMLNIDVDGVGYDDIQLSLDDFENAISALAEPSCVPQANELLPHVSKSVCRHVYHRIVNHNLEYDECIKCGHIK